MHCATCEDTTRPIAGIFVCRNCIQSSRGRSTFFLLKAAQAYYRKHKKFKELRRDHPSLYRKLSKFGVKRSLSHFCEKKLRTPMDVFMEKRLSTFYCRGLIAKAPPEVRGYMKEVYGTLLKYREACGVTKYNWIDCLKKIKAIRGVLTPSGVREYSVPLYEYIRKNVGWRKVFSVTGVNISLHHEWDIQKVVEHGIRIFDVCSPDKLWDMQNHYGLRFVQVANDLFFKEQIGFVEQMRRNKSASGWRKNGIVVEEHFGLVRSVIQKQFSFCLNNPAIYEQAFSAGMEGLLVAAGVFDPENRKGSWSTCAWSWIRAKIQRDLENNDPFSMIRIPCHKQKDKELKKQLQTLSLDQKLETDGDEEFSKYVGDQDEEEFEQDIIYNFVSKKFSHRVANAFFNHFLKDVAWRFSDKLLKEVKDAISTEFYPEWKR